MRFHLQRRHWLMSPLLYVRLCPRAPARVHNVHNQVCIYTYGANCRVAFVFLVCVSVPASLGKKICCIDSPLCYFSLANMSCTHKRDSRKTLIIIWQETNTIQNIPGKICVAAKQRLFGALLRRCISNSKIRHFPATHWWCYSIFIYLYILPHVQMIWPYVVYSGAHHAGNGKR